jgi:magnesium transporter
MAATEIVQSLGGAERQRLTSLRERGDFFWIDVSLSETELADLGSALDIPARVLGQLAFGPPRGGSRGFYADEQYVVFPSSCYVEPAEVSGGSTFRTRSAAVHVLVSSDYLLTVHQERVSLPAVLAPHLPTGRTRQYVVYAVLDAMLDSAFDALHEVEDKLDALAETSANLGGGRVRMATLRAITARLTSVRRAVAPQRAVLERIGAEIERLPGLKAGEERYFDSLAEQSDRLVNAIEVASNNLTTLVDLRLNETSYWLTVVATIFLPLTFVTGFFGMNFTWMIDQIDTALAFFFLGIGACLASVFVVWHLLGRVLPVEAERAGPSPQAHPRGEQRA